MPESSHLDGGQALDPQQAKLAQQLRTYRGVDLTEEKHRLRILQQVEATPLWWHRDTLPGHVTASAFIVDPSLEQILLVHHRKLDRWLQPGGHDDGERDPAISVLREIEEECALKQVRFFGDYPQIFDVDVHGIPARPDMPEHLHLDVRFLILADPRQVLQHDPEESHQIAWWSLARAYRELEEESLLRPLRKIAEIRRASKPSRQDPRFSESEPS
ncbi:MAG: NUDIX domain-containing protein [Planctomycetota bacterium]|nr:MAG: NUDIX domain-containing protein [Planctomycetota bacterium]